MDKEEIIKRDMWRVAKPKWLSWFNDELELRWYNRVTPADVEATYMAMVNLPKKKLEAVLEDEMQPILVHIIAKHLIDNNFDVLEKILDRGMWKAIQRSENINKEIIIKIKDYEWWEHNSITA